MTKIGFIYLLGYSCCYFLLLRRQQQKFSYERSGYTRIRLSLALMFDVFFAGVASIFWPVLLLGQCLISLVDRFC
jgi:hypothetical protein